MDTPFKNSKTFPVLCGLLADRPTRLSQAMHSAGFQAEELPFEYIAFDTVDTAGALNAMRVLGIRGLSLTIPHKEAAIALIDNASDDVREIGAVNTVINEDGRLKGYNTDWIGIRDALIEAKFDPAGKSVLIFGAGGASRAAIVALKRMKAGSISVTNRSADRGKKLAETAGVQFLPIEQISTTAIGSFNLFINSTPIGSKLAAPDQQFSFDLTCFKPGHCVFDLVTTPTELTKIAKTAGAVAIAGSRMLLFQALEQFRLFTGRAAPREVMERALEEELRRVV